MNAILQVNNLSLRYGSQRVFQNFNLSVPSNQITALVGPSGCGKSSLLLSINRLIDSFSNAVLSGDLIFEGNSVFSLEPRELRKKIGIIFQNPVPFPFSIRNNFHIPLIEHGISRRSERDEIIERVLKQVSLWDEVKGRLDRPANELSGGQKQRLCIARALSLKPSLLLMDEPCSSLDPMSTEVIEELMSNLKSHLTILIVTHNIAQAKRVSDRLAVCWVRNECGVLEECGDTQTLFKNPKSGITSQYLEGIKG